MASGAYSLKKEQFATLQITEAGRPLGDVKAKNRRYTIPT